MRLFSRLSILTILLVAGLLLFIHHSGTEATSDTLWGPDADAPTVEVTSGNYTPSQEEMYNCHDHDFVVLASNDFDHPFTKVFQDMSFGRCAFYSGFGIVSSDFMQLNGYFRPYHISNNVQIKVVPNEKSLFLTYSTGGLAAVDDVLRDTKIGPGSDYLSLGVTYKNQYYLNIPDDRRVLKDSEGKNIFYLSKFAPSGNAHWFVAQRYKQFIRIQSDDFSNLLAFPATGEYDTWGDPEPGSLAITNDGRYIAAAGSNRGTLKLYDLSTCQKTSSYNMDNESGCGAVDLSSYLQQQLSLPIVQVNYPRFSDDGTELNINVVVNDNGAKRNELVTLVAPGAEYRDSLPQPTNYIAMGDSYASGEGTFDYLSGTDEDNNKCHLSSVSYPYLLEPKLKLDSAHSVACSGAKIVNVNGGAVAAAQYTARPADAFSDEWLPGYSPQIDFVDVNKPNIVTISMVGNDVGFASIIKQCVVFGTCFQTYESRMGLVLNINSKFDNLVAMYTQIKADAAPGAKVYVVGYPDIVEPDGNCGENVHLTKGETEFASNLINYLDDVIRQAARAAGVAYIDSGPVFSAHRLCDSGEKAVNGLTYRGSVNPLNLFSSGSYHPNKLGHELLANAVETQTDGFREPMPSPDWSIETPDMSLAADLLNAPKSDGPTTVRKIEFDDKANLVIGSDRKVQGELDHQEFHLQPGTLYDSVVNSASVDLGVIESDSEGNLTYNFTLPSVIEPGWHTLHIYGNDITGQAVDIERLIYVAASDNDWDGDGIPNDQEACGLIPASHVDVDNDGIDDACDDVISTVPLPGAPTVSATTPVNLSNQHQVIVSGSGEANTTVHISIDDTDASTPAVSTTIALTTSAAYSKSLDVSSLDDGPLVVKVYLSNVSGNGPAATTNVSKDTVAPQLRITQTPLANAAGWNNEPVDVQLSASDGGSGVASITYSSTGADVISDRTTAEATTVVNIDKEGVTQISGSATDKAGNESSTSTENIKLDLTPPSAAISPRPFVIGLFGTSLYGQSEDNLSGLASTTVRFYGWQRGNQVVYSFEAECVAGCDTGKEVWSANPSRLPTGHYWVQAQSTDMAGNQGPLSPGRWVQNIGFPWFWNRVAQEQFNERRSISW